jgi:hypothetical protein
MWKPFRQSLISDHLFYVEQAQKRLLSQFDDIENDAKKAAEHWLEQHRYRFDPDRHNPEDFYESAYDHSIGFYHLLSDMRDQTRLSVVAGMFHEWDKQLRDWLANEIQRLPLWNAAVSTIWSVDFGKIVEFLACLGWTVRGTTYFTKLDACRLVVNVYKHGKGGSLEELKVKYPEYLPDPFKRNGDSLLDFNYLDHTNLAVSDDHIREFSEAIVEFWNNVPTDVCDNEIDSVPSWFERAVAKESRK